MKSVMGMTWRSSGSSWPSTGRRSSSVRVRAGSPAREALISGPRSRNSALRSGASPLSCVSVGLSSRAAGRSSVTTGLAKRAKRSRRFVVVVASCSKVGRTRKKSARSRLRAAVVENTRSLF